MVQTPTDLAKDLREGKITYQQYQDGLAAYDAVPAADAVPEADPKKILAEQMSQRANVSIGNAALGQPTTSSPPAPAQAPSLNAGTFTISAPPAPGATSLQPTDGAQMPPAQPTGDAVLSALIQQRGAPGRAVGLSPSDKAHVAELGQRGAGYGAVTDEATQGIQGIQDQMAKSNAILDQQTAIATMAHEAGLQKDQLMRSHVEAEHREARSRIAAELADLSARNINPNAYWQNRSTPTKFAGALAVAFSTFGSQYGRGGTNAALEIFNHAIDQEIDAQRTNMQKALSVAKGHMELEGSQWDHDIAMLKAERDSTEVAYQTAMHQVDSTAARFRDNAAFQAKAVEVKAGLQTQLLEKAGSLNDQIYAAMKRAETVVGGADNKIAQQIIARTQKIRDDNPNVTPEEARSLAAREILGVNMTPGAAMPTMGKTKPEDIAKTTVLVDGKPMQAVNEEQAKSFAKFQEAFPEEQRLHRELTDAWTKQDWGRYQQARAAFIELAPRVYGFARGPSGAQAGEGSHDDASIKATVAGQLPEMGVLVNDPHYWGGRGATMLSQVGEHLNSLYDNMWRTTFTAPSPGNPLGLQRR